MEKFSGSAPDMASNMPTTRQEKHVELTLENVIVYYLVYDSHYYFILQPEKINLQKEIAGACISYSPSTSLNDLQQCERRNRIDD